jgi:hypothetical protein
VQRKTALLLLLIAVTAGILPGRVAVGSVSQPDVAAIQATTQAPISRDAPLHGLDRVISSYAESAEGGGQVLKSLKPVRRADPIDFDEATALLSGKTWNEKVFNKDFAGKMQGQYIGRVKPYEEIANNPVWHAHYWETQRYEDGRQGLAKWTAHEVMEDQLKDFFAGADKNSSAMQAIATARALSGGEEEKPKEKKLTPEEKIAREARTDLPKEKQEDEVTPTKLKTKMNVLKQNGAVVFTNPVATTEMNANKDEVSMNMHRDFRKIKVSSNLAYAIRQGLLNLSLSKQITERISLSLDHYNYTGEHADGNGYKSRESARMNYSTSF